MFHLEDINYAAVLIATVATMILGFLWYSPILFGNAWRKRIGKKAEDMSGGGPLTYILTAVTAIVGVWIVAAIVTLTDGTVGAGLLVGLLVGIAVSAKIGMNYLFEGRGLGLFFITIGYHVVSFLIAGLVIGAM